MRKSLSLLLLALAASAPAFAADTAAPAGVKNIVIVPGAFVDGSSWRVVHDILIHQGYTVNVVQPRVDTLADDVEAVYRQLRKEAGPTLLVGSDYDGAVITQAGTRDKVKGLIYVAAVAPSVGESTLQLVDSMPEPSHDLQTSFDGYIYADAQKFGADFAADLTSNRTNFMAVAQVPGTVAAFRAVTEAAAWRSKPSWAVLATEDRVYSPELQRAMYQRAGAKVTEIKGSHLVYLSQPEQVAQVIADAAQSLK
ncbi:alpha/beta fold hydrolase [Dyella acidiphila]|uniref:Alpha/beta hydrolase n=1 Tax=Dyella acidiphila TaxID=2775866 RepID=A0ABR9GDX7_9GAMM|nr:alpha/beta hydrolase [Dyella acidiphila]MBE1162251.1 alpha/beta hydrolase [Dyella acidiphila]